jgi:acetyl-CoA carboxylase carboxyl transferase subunit alpha
LKAKLKNFATCKANQPSTFQKKLTSWPKKSLQLTKDIYSQPSPGRSPRSRAHAERPYTLDYINDIFTHFVELHGDRHFADDLSIVGGLARFNGSPSHGAGPAKRP